MSNDSASLIFFYGLSLGGVMGLAIGLGIGFVSIIFTLAECLV